MPKVTSIAVIGCGAIAESYYFPALAANPHWRPMVWLVEPSEARRRAAVDGFGFDARQQAASVEALPQAPDLAINCTPSHLHLATSLPLLEQGTAMIVEKPLAESAEDAACLIAAAGEETVLSVNHHRRLGGSSQLIFDYVRSGKLGPVRSIRWAEGRKFEWPTQSGFNFRRPWAGRPRGAVLDIGVHVVDLISWWLGERLAVRAARLDGYGGPECYAELSLSGSTAQVEIVLSFHTKLANTFEIVGEKGAIRGSVQDYDWVEFQSAGGVARVQRLGASAGRGMAERLIDNVIAAVETGAEPIIGAPSVLPALETIDEIYARAADPMPACYGEWAA